MNWLHLSITLVAMSGLVWLARRLSGFAFLPYPTLLLLAGFFGSEALVYAGVDTGLRWGWFRDLVYFVLLPLLVYEAAFRLNAACLLQNMVVVMLLAIPLMLVGVLLTAVLLYLGIDHASGFPVVAALITAALVSTNDPAAVTRVLEGIQVPARLASLLEGESLFNSIIALVLVSLALQVEMHDVRVSDGIGFLQGFILFVRLFTGGVLTGLAVGLAGWVLLHVARLPVLRAVFSVLLAYGAFLVADQLFRVSGVVAVLTAGLVLNAYAQRTDQLSRRMLERCWQWSAALTGTMLFLLLGMSVYLPLLLGQWKAVLLAIAAVLLARAVIVFAGLGLYGKVAGEDAVTLQEQIPLFWGGIKGAVTVALLFALPEALEYSGTILAMVYGVVLFSLLVQAPGLRALLLYRTRRQEAVRE